MAAKKKTLSEIAQIDRDALEPYQRLEEVNSRRIIESFFDDAMAPIQEMIALQQSLTPEQYHADLWTQKYGSADDAKIASIAFASRLWQLTVAKNMLSDVQKAQADFLAGTEREKLVSALVKKRVNLLCGWFVAYRHAIQSETKGCEVALDYLTASVYRQLKRTTSSGVPMRYAQVLEEEHKEKNDKRTPDHIFRQALETELPPEVFALLNAEGLSPASVAKMPTNAARSIEHSGRHRQCVPETNLFDPENNLSVTVALASDKCAQDKWLDQLLSEDRTTDLQEAMAKLPLKQRETMLLWCQGYTYQEIAELRQVSFQTIKSQVGSAIESIKDQLSVAA